MERRLSSQARGSRLFRELTMTTQASEFTRIEGCDLCRAVRMTPWYHEDDVCWIAECDVCDTPMVVWRWHGTAPPAEHVEHMRARLHEVATAQIGRASCRERCYALCRSRWSPYH